MIDDPTSMEPVRLSNRLFEYESYEKFVSFPPFYSGLGLLRLHKTYL